jgi:hypothetical protein
MDPVAAKKGKNMLPVKQRKGTCFAWSFHVGGEAPTPSGIYDASEDLGGD